MTGELEVQVFDSTPDDGLSSFWKGFITDLPLSLTQTSRMCGHSNPSSPQGNEFWAPEPESSDAC